MSNWTKEWPTEPGDYYFYGKYKNSDLPFDLKYCKARKAGSDGRQFLSLVVDGAFCHKSEQLGLFKKIEKVDLPTEEELADLLDQS